MTTYNTGNPVGSADPKDLYDNAEAFDRAINDSAATFTDRLGNERPTLKRLEVDYPLAGVYADQAALSAENAQLAATGAVAAQASAVSAKLAADAALAGIQGEADEIAANAAASATAIAVSAKDGAVIAKTAAEAARDATVVGAAPTVYATTAAGLAATTSGKYFSVPSADSAEYLILYLNNAGTAVEQKRYPATSVFADVEARIATEAASGVYPHPLWRATLATTNLTDSVAVTTWTKTRTGAFTRIAPGLIGSDGKIYAHSIDMKAGGYRTRIRHVVNVITVLGNNANSKVGICLDDGAIKTLLLVEAASGVIRKQIVGGATETVATGGAQWEDGSQLDIFYDILHETGEVIVSYSVNGGNRIYASFAGLTTRGQTVSLAQFSNFTYEHRLEIEGVGALEKPQSSANTSLVSVANLLKRNNPAGWNPTRALPSDFVAYHYNGKFATSYDAITSPINEASHAAVVYVDPILGADTNEGTQSAPLKSLAKAVTAVRYAKRALVKPKAGNYTSRDLSFGSVVIYSQVFAVVPWGDGRVVSAPAYTSQTWTINTGATWQTTLTLSAAGAVSVYDAANLTPAGDHSALVSRASIALVDANPGSYYLSGSTLYVRTIDGRQPDANLKVYDTFLGTLSYIVNGGTLYAERIDAIGSTWGFHSNQGAPYTGGSTIILNDVTGAYHKNNGLWAYGSGLCVSINSRFYANQSDGMSYGSFPAQGGLPNVAIEVNVTSRDNGAGSADQASTTHSGTTACRVNGTYKANGGQGVADVNNAWSWFLGCSAQGGSLSNTAYHAGNATDDTSKLWLDACVAINSTTAINVGTSGAAYTSNFTANGGAITGNVAGYTP